MREFETLGHARNLFLLINKRIIADTAPDQPSAIHSSLFVIKTVSFRQWKYGGTEIFAVHQKVNMAREQNGHPENKLCCGSRYVRAAASCSIQPAIGQSVTRASETGGLMKQ
jgi:hypothetical protein